MTEEFELPEKLHENHLAITKYSRHLRGKFLERMILIEHLISESLIELTSSDKTEESIRKHLFSSTITLEIKINLFCSLNKANAFDCDDIHKTLNSDLKELQKLRNLLAHSVLDTTFEFLENYNGTFIRYQSHTNKGIQLIDIYYKDKEENIQKNIFNSTLIRRKVIDCENSLVNIQSNLLSKK